MKRIVLSFLLFLMVGVITLFLNSNQVLAEGVVKHDLLAGKSHKVGEIHVWNDVDTLYVKYFINEGGWEMTESHLYVGSFAKLPKNRPGNPVVGHFPHKRTHNPAVKEYIYEIPKESINSDNMVVAAHASLQHKSEVTINPTINWTRSSENYVPTTPGYGGQWQYDDVIGEFSDMTGNVWDNGLYNSQRPIIPGINYASWEYAYNNGGGYANYSDLRLFRASFNIPAKVEVLNAHLGVVDYNDRIPINDNVYVYVNSELLFWGGTRANDIGMHNGMAGIQAIGYPSTELLESDGWYIPGVFPNIDDLKAGSNKIEVFTEENHGWGGMGKLILTVSGMKVDKTDSAWGAGTRINSRGNWGTYFNYYWQPTKELVDTVTVLADGSNVSSNIELEDGKTYILKVSGTYRFAEWGETGIADAKYSFRRPANIPDGYDKSENQWVDGAHLSKPYYLQVWINNEPANWVGTFNTNHKYTKTIVGQGDELLFKIMDDYYGDNSGSLTVKIYSYN